MACVGEGAGKNEMGLDALYPNLRMASSLLDFDCIKHQTSAGSGPSERTPHSEIQESIG